MSTPRVISHLDQAVDAVLEAVPGDIVLGIPLAIGKPNALSMRCTGASPPCPAAG